MAEVQNELPRSIVFLTIHKGASTFIADDFAGAMEQLTPSLKVVRYGSEKLLGSSPESLVVPRESALFVRVYPGDVGSILIEGAGERKFDDVSLVLLLRDPRDAAISFYYSAAFSHSLEVANAEKFIARRNQLQQMTLQEGVAACATPALAEFRSVLRLSREYPEALLTTYEELVTGYPDWLEAVCEHVGWSEDIRGELQRLTGDSFIPPETEDVLEHKRRVTPGNWVEVFDDHLTELFKTECGDEMDLLGYEW